MNELFAEIKGGFLPVRIRCQRCAGSGIEPHGGGPCSHCHGRGKLVVLRWFYAAIDEYDEPIEMTLEEIAGVD